LKFNGIICKQFNIPWILPVSRLLSTGLSPKFFHRNQANGMTAGKGEESEVATSSKSTWGFS
jgi:hypothetical protein